MDGTASGQGVTPHSSPSLHDHKHAPEKLGSSNPDLDEELESLQLKDSKTRGEKVTFAKEDQVEELEPTVPMNISPDIEESKSPDLEEQACSEKYKQGGELKVDAFEEKELDSLKPSPNISTDFEESSTPSKSATKECQVQLNSNILANSNLDAVTMSPATGNTKTSLKRVRDYIQSLPSPQAPSRRGDGLNTDSFPSELKTNLSMTEEADNSSMCSGSQSLVSRQSDMSSMTGARMGRGMFYGAGPTICTFPEEWNQIIPESIENDEDID